MVQFFFIQAAAGSFSETGTSDAVTGSPAAYYYGNQL